jgi:hypothetical protein
VAKTHEICRLDFAPIFASQVGTVSGLQVLPTSDPLQVEARFFRDAERHDPIVLTYCLVNTSQGLRIDDIRSERGQDEKWSLRAQLETDP